MVASYNLEKLPSKVKVTIIFPGIPARKMLQDIRSQLCLRDYL